MLKSCLLALVLEPVAELTNLFLQLAYVQKDDTYPIVADLATERFSDVVVILQYLSAMLLGQTPRRRVMEPRVRSRKSAFFTSTAMVQ